MSAGGIDELAHAYEGLEAEDSFPDREALTRYREGMLERSRPQADFLAPRLGSGASVFEVACGNGRLLVELARRGVAAEAFGIDIARSRIEFARRWAADEGLDSLEFEAGDALERPVEPGSFTAALCITGAFAYFEPALPGSATRLAGRMREALAPGGVLCLELYPHPSYLPLLDATDGDVRLWKELGPEDPWRFYLSHLTLDDSGKVLTHEKTFVHRSSGEIDEGRRERLYLYGEDDLRELLEGEGFEDVRFFEGWAEEPYAGGELMVVTAARP